MTVETEERHEVQLARQRSNVYALLSAIYIKEPTPELIAKLRTPELSSTLEQLGVVFDPMFDENAPEEVCEELVLEYTRLYLGPGRHIPPYEAPQVGASSEEGEFRYGMMWGNATKQVEEDYRRLGYELIAGFSGAPDHIAAELHLMCVLAADEADAWQRGDRKSAVLLLNEQRAFLENHLGRWGPSFCEQAADFSRVEFYRTLALLTKEFITSELEALPQLAGRA